MSKRTFRDPQFQLLIPLLLAWAVSFAYIGHLMLHPGHTFPVLLMLIAASLCLLTPVLAMLYMGQVFYRDRCLEFYTTEDRQPPFHYRRNPHQISTYPYKKHTTLFWCYNLTTCMIYFLISAAPVILSALHLNSVSPDPTPTDLTYMFISGMVNISMFTILLVYLLRQAYRLEVLHYPYTGNVPGNTMPFLSGSH